MLDIMKALIYNNIIEKSKTISQTAGKLAACNICETRLCF